MLAKLLLLFTVVPIVETFLLFTLGQHLGPWITVFIVIATGVLGAALSKREGLKVWRQWTEALAEGRLPEEGIVSGLLVLVGGVLLVTPGVMTDVTGMLLLIPPSRRVVARYVRAYAEKRFADAKTTTRFRVDLGDGNFAERVETHFGGRRRAADPNVIDTDGEVLEERRQSDGDAGPARGRLKS